MVKWSVDLHKNVLAPRATPGLFVTSGMVNMI